MDINVRRRGQVPVIQLRGPLRMGQAVDGFREAVHECLNGGDTSLVINLEEVSMIDSSGVGALVKSMTSVKQLGRLDQRPEAGAPPTARTPPLKPKEGLSGPPRLPTPELTRLAVWPNIATDVATFVDSRQDAGALPHPGVDWRGGYG